MPDLAYAPDSERFAVCQNCNGEGSIEEPHPQRDDPYYAAVRQCRACGGAGYVEKEV